MPGKVIGIDLGTTNSVVAVMEAGQPAVIAGLGAGDGLYVYLAGKNQARRADNLFFLRRGLRDLCPGYPHFE